MAARYEYAFRCGGCGATFSIAERKLLPGDWMRVLILPHHQVEPRLPSIGVGPQGHAFLINRGDRTQICVEHEACGYNGEALPAGAAFFLRPPACTLRFLCPGCLKPYSKDFAVLPPGEEVLLTLYGTYTAPLMALLFAAPAEGILKLRRDGDGSYAVHLHHEKCGYNGPAKILPPPAGDSEGPG